MTSKDKENLIIGPGEGKVLPIPGHKITAKISGESTDNRFVLAELELTGDGPPRHIHKTEDEFFYLLEGEVKFLLGEQIQIVKTGSTIIVPMGTVHAFARVNKKNANYLLCFLQQELKNSLMRYLRMVLSIPNHTLLKPKSWPRSIT